MFDHNNYKEHISASQRSILDTVEISARGKSLGRTYVYDKINLIPYHSTFYFIELRYYYLITINYWKQSNNFPSMGCGISIFTTNPTFSN